MPYRQSFAFVRSAFLAAKQNQVTSRCAKRAPLENVGRQPLKLRAYRFAAVEVAT